MSKQKMNFYKLDNILKYNAQYNLIIGERSNGKTYAILDYCIKRYFKAGEKMAYIRRWREDIRGKRGQNLFTPLINNDINGNVIEKYSDGKYNDIFYYAGKWYFAFTEVNERGELETEHDKEPFAYSYALTEMEHDKGTSNPAIVNVFFDEFLTRKAYLPDEFILFMNTLSTIIRYRDNVKIFMCGNTVNQYSPYFAEMGLTNIENMKQGAIDIYTYGNSELKVVVEFSDSPAKNKPSDKYFAFDNPKLNMIKGKSGVWEMNVYPHAPCKYTRRDILFIFFIIFNNYILQCEIVSKDGTAFIYIHEKTTEIQNPDSDLIYTLEYSHKPNIRRRIDKPTNNTEKIIYDLFNNDKVFYQDNKVGELVRNYLQQSTHSLYN